MLYFKCSDSAMIERLINRGKFSGRVDDNEETIKKRLKVFHENSDPILKYLKEKVVEFDSNKTVDDLFADVDEFIRKLLNLWRKNINFGSSNFHSRRNHIKKIFILIIEVFDFNDMNKFIQQKYQLSYQSSTILITRFRIDSTRRAWTNQNIRILDLFIMMFYRFTIWTWWISIHLLIITTHHRWPSRWIIRTLIMIVRWPCERFRLIVINCFDCSLS